MLLDDANRQLIYFSSFTRAILHIDFISAALLCPPLLMDGAQSARMDHVPGALEALALPSWLALGTPSGDPG